jgi:CheY-like chemotaxis protein
MAIKIMIVEDEIDMANLLRFIFERFGYEVMEAHNGQEALDMLKPDSSSPNLPDIIITDVMMPVIDGYTLITRLEENEKLRKIPVVVATAKGHTRDIFQSSNIVGFMEKPFEPSQLKTLVEKVLKKK